MSLNFREAEMPATTEKPVSTPAKLPSNLEERVHARIGSMSKRELKVWRRDSLKIIDHLRASCAGNIPKQPDPEPAEDVTPRCCECDYHLIGKVIKGRGIVWECSNVGCAIYGREQRQR